MSCFKILNQTPNPCELRSKTKAANSNLHRTAPDSLTIVVCYPITIDRIVVTTWTSLANRKTAEAHHSRFRGLMGLDVDED